MFAVLLALVVAKRLYFYAAAAGGTSAVDDRNKGNTVTLPGGKGAAAGAAFLAATAVVALVAAFFTLVHLGINVVAVNGAVVFSDEMWRAAQAMETAATGDVVVATGVTVFGRYVLAYVRLLKMEGDSAVQTTPVITATVTSLIIAVCITAVITKIVAGVMDPVNVVVTAAGTFFVKGATMVKVVNVATVRVVMVVTVT